MAPESVGLEGSAEKGTFYPYIACPKCARACTGMPVFFVCCHGVSQEWSFAVDDVVVKEPRICELRMPFIVCDCTLQLVLEVLKH